MLEFEREKKVLNNGGTIGCLMEEKNGATMKKREKVKNCLMKEKKGVNMGKRDKVMIQIFFFWCIRGMREKEKK